MKAIWNDKVVEEADKKNLIFIEGNWYFPKDAVNAEFLSPSQTHTTCQWKGEASYCDVTVDGRNNQGAAWYYPDPKPTAFELTKKTLPTISHPGGVLK